MGEAALGLHRGGLRGGIMGIYPAAGAELRFSTWWWGRDTVPLCGINQSFAIAVLLLLEFFVFLCISGFTASP